MNGRREQGVPDMSLEWPPHSTCTPDWLQQYALSSITFNFKKLFNWPPSHNSYTTLPSHLPSPPCHPSVLVPCLSFDFALRAFLFVYTYFIFTLTLRPSLKLTPTPPFLPLSHHCAHHVPKRFPIWTSPPPSTPFELESGLSSQVTLFSFARFVCFRFRFRFTFRFVLFVLFWKTFTAAVF